MKLNFYLGELGKEKLIAYRNNIEPHLIPRSKDFVMMKVRYHPLGKTVKLMFLSIGMFGRLTDNNIWKII